MINTAVRTELVSFHTYLKYLLETVDNLLDEVPTENIYEAAWLSKCLNLEEILTIFQNQFFNKREKLNLVLDRAIKALNNDVDTKIKTTSLEENSAFEEARDNAIMGHVNALGNSLTTVNEEIQKKLEITETAIKSYGNEMLEIRNYLQNELIPTVLKCTQILNPQVSQDAAPEIFETDDQKKMPEPISILEITEENKKIPEWIEYVDQVKQKMEENKLSAHEISEYIKINFNSFRKFQKKDPTLSKTALNKILRFFEINK